MLCFIALPVVTCACMRITMTVLCLYMYENARLPTLAEEHHVCMCFLVSQYVSYYFMNWFVLYTSIHMYVYGVVLPFSNTLVGSFTCTKLFGTNNHYMYIGCTDYLLGTL